MMKKPLLSQQQKDYENENPVIKQKRIIGEETVITNIFNYQSSEAIIFPL